MGHSGLFFFIFAFSKLTVNIINKLPCKKALHGCLSTVACNYLKLEKIDNKNVLKNCWRLDSNLDPLVFEVTALQVYVIK